MLFSNSVSSLGCVVGVVGSQIVLDRYLYSKLLTPNKNSVDEGRFEPGDPLYKQ